MSVFPGKDTLGGANLGTWRIPTLNRGPVTIETTTISAAWSTALAALVAPGVDTAALLSVSINLPPDGASPEIPAVKQALDISLRAEGEKPIDTVASTIFPLSMWDLAQPRQALFDRYLRVLPKLKRASSANRYGMYFERMIDWPDRGANAALRRNQLDHIIRTYQANNHRRSALQVAIFDPAKDHTHQRQRGFPCLNQIAFQPDSRSGTLAVTGVYALQNIYEKAYGNYLGLYHLGQFMAHELQLELVQVNCIASTAVRGAITKAGARRLLEQLPASPM